MRRIAASWVFTLAIVAACGGGSTPTPSAATGATATPAASPAGGGSAGGAGTVTVTYGDKTVTLTGATCADSKKLGVDVRAGGTAPFTENGPDGIMMLVPHDGTAPTIAGRIDNKPFAVTSDNAKGTVGDDLSGTFSGQDQDGVTVEGTFRCQ